MKISRGVQHWSLLIKVKVTAAFFPIYNGNCQDAMYLRFGLKLWVKLRSFIFKPFEFLCLIKVFEYIFYELLVLKIIYY